MKTQSKKQKAVSPFQVAIWLHAMRLASASSNSRWHQEQWNKAFDAQQKHTEEHGRISIVLLDTYARAFMEAHPNDYR